VALLVLWLWWLLLLTGFMPLTAWAALTISPPQLTPDEQGVVVTQVQSSLAQPSRWSVRLVTWNAEAGPFEPAQGQVSPRFFSLNPNEVQVVRARPLNRAGYHRLVIEQIPSEDLQQGLSFQFRFSLPVFRFAQEPLKHRLELRPQSTCERLQNTQNLAIQVLLPPEVMGLRTLLPGQSSEYCRRPAAIKTGSP
jgi:P pilus assembly chaperone PapD